MLLFYNRKYKLGGNANETDLTLSFPNGSIIHVSGANDKAEIEKFRGLSITLCYLDEAQSFPAYIEDLIDDVVTPALFDNNGTLALIGTPGPIPNGYFYECSQSKGWSHHFWSLFDNPFIMAKSGKTSQALLDEELHRRGVGANDPKIQREFFGKWVLDLDSLVFKYNKDRNDYDELPITTNKWNYVIGIDLGFHDADAIAVLAYNPDTPKAYLVEEIITKQQGITELIEQIQRVIIRYNPEQLVIDTGGLGKKIAEELNKRYSIPVRAADKQRKIENIELLNDAMRTSKFFADSKSRFANDCHTLEWDLDKTRPDKKVISNRFHSDICDAVLYAFRELYHWLFEPKAEKIQSGTQEYYNQIAKELEEQLEQNLLDNQEPKTGFD